MTPTHTYNATIGAAHQHHNKHQFERTPLFEAAFRNASAAVELLLINKANVNALNHVGEAWWWGRGACAVDCMLVIGWTSGCGQ